MGLARIFKFFTNMHKIFNKYAINFRVQFFNFEPPTNAYDHIFLNYWRNFCEKFDKILNKFWKNGKISIRTIHKLQVSLDFSTQIAVNSLALMRPLYYFCFFQMKNWENERDMTSSILKVQIVEGKWGKGEKVGTLCIYSRQWTERTRRWIRSGMRMSISSEFTVMPSGSPREQAPSTHIREDRRWWEKMQIVQQGIEHDLHQTRQDANCEPAFRFLE